MKARSWTWWKSLLLVPLASVYGFESCTADAVRDVADGLNDVANEVDGGNSSDIDLGDWLADQVDDL
jgi:hypothetical protein